MIDIKKLLGGLALSLLVSTSIQAHEGLHAASSDDLKIMSYNTYFLFDDEDDPDCKIDAEFPKGAKDCNGDQACWTKIYQQKLRDTATLINVHNPDVLALGEVENKRVLQEREAQLNVEYGIAHFESRDSWTGQDVALLYNKDKFTISSKLKNNLKFAADYYKRDKYKGDVLIFKAQTLAKGILEIGLTVKQTGEEIIFLVTHLKSQRGGDQADLKRMAQANTLRKKIEEVHAQNDKVIVMGDFNDVYGSSPIDLITGIDETKNGKPYFRDILNRKYNHPNSRYNKEDNYTYQHLQFININGKWRPEAVSKTRIDFIMASESLMDRIDYNKTEIDHQSVDMENRQPSDHAPIITYLSLE